MGSQCFSKRGSETIPNARIGQITEQNRRVKQSEKAQHKSTHWISTSVQKSYSSGFTEDGRNKANLQRVFFFLTHGHFKGLQEELMRSAELFNSNRALNLSR